MTSDEDAESNLNALQDNIARKGNNAYYYAHQLKASGPHWNGEDAPQLLERQASEPAKAKRAITRYSWLDAEAKVKIYLPFDDERASAEGAVRLDWTETSLTVVVDVPDATHTLRIPKLYDKINNATFKVKQGDKILVTLTKAPSSPDLEGDDAKPHKWWDLKK